jgi:hypothetical protein
MQERELPSGKGVRSTAQTPGLFGREKGTRQPTVDRREPYKPKRDLTREIQDMRPLNEAERVLVHAVGQFRTVAADDLHGDWNIRVMKELGLVRSHWITPHSVKEIRKRDQTTTTIRRPATKAPKLHVLTLTRKGAAWLIAHGYDERALGKLHAGITKEREAFHDARLYALAKAERDSLKEAGNTPLATHTDTYLKSLLHTETARLKTQGHAQTDAQELAAASLSLPIVDGKCMLPDARIEYTQPNGQQAYIDLELISDTYSRANIAAKGAAGFKGYTANSSGGFTPQGGGSVWDPDYISRLFGR